MKKKSKVSNPELFQGFKKTKDYFEGWYFKHVDEQRKNVLSVIPGIHFEGNIRSCFIQVIIGSKSYYVECSYDDFSWSDNPFSVRIGDSFFSLNEIVLDIQNKTFSLKGKIKYSKITSLNSSIISPNIMGGFAYIKSMECNHSVISLEHNLSGKMFYNEQIIDFENGKGYIEKDWGTSFPKGYCWVQCNSFNNDSISLFASIANIPFAGTSFTGHICVVKIKDKQYRFATYNLSKIAKLSSNNNFLYISLKKGKYKLIINCKMNKGMILKAPKNGLMETNIKESIEGTVFLNYIVVAN